MNLRPLALGLGLLTFFAAAAGIGSAQFGPNPEVPLPVATRTPPTPAPGASPSGRPTRGKKGSSGSASPEPTPSDTPEPPQFSTIDGVWEIELQPLGAHSAIYSHVTLAVTGGQITGTYQYGPKGTKAPLTGAYDGRLIQLTATTETGPVTFSGYVENNADMVGMYRTKPTDAGIAFTGQHRKKEKGGP